MSGAVSSRITAGERIARKNKKQNTYGNQCSDDQLRQVLAEIGVQRLNPIDGRIDQLASSLLAREGRTESHDLFEQPLAQIIFDLHCHARWR